MAAIVCGVNFFGLGLIIKSAKSHLNDVAELLEEKYQRRRAFFLLTAYFYGNMETQPQTESHNEEACRPVVMVDCPP